MLKMLDNFIFLDNKKAPIAGGLIYGGSWAIRTPDQLIKSLLVYAAINLYIQRLTANALSNKSTLPNTLSYCYKTSFILALDNISAFLPGGSSVVSAADEVRERIGTKIINRF